MPILSLSSVEACQKFIATQEPSSIAERLRRDQQLCRERSLPTVLAHFLPSSSSAQGIDIAKQLLSDSGVHIPLVVRRMQYDGIVAGIKGYLAQMEHHEEVIGASVTESAADATNGRDPPNVFESKMGISEAPPDFSSTSTRLDLKTTLDGLRCLRESGSISEKATLPQILSVLEAMTVPKEEEKSRSMAFRDRPKKCYICRYFIKETHELYPALCKPCGTFNLAESGLSSPARLSLIGKSALVTGGRVNLGFHIALKLLRCGGNVIVSTRYPQDAEVRYRAEHDSKSWIGRLRIVGADFRTAKDVFRLVASIKTVLADWGGGSTSLGQLFILVNNAAQTLTDPVAAERQAIANESQLQQRTIEASSMVLNTGYQASLRGGSLMPGGLLESSRVEDHIAQTPYESYSSQKTVVLDAPTLFDERQSALDIVQSKSSWMQTLSEIPYEDIITAHSVNAFVPLILIRELLSVMPQYVPKSDIPNSHIRPLAHVLNVSSREGIFEAQPTSRDKNGQHVHTNMSKAGLNMITETEAAALWESRRIAMNTVDPGYMSAAPEMRNKFTCPINFDDGAGRVLWSVASAETAGNDGSPAIWGRFLKHFGEVRVDVGLGR